MRGGRSALGDLAPVTLIYAVSVMAVVSVVPSSFAWLGALLLLAGPVMGTLLLATGTIRARIVSAAVATVVAAFVSATVVFGLLPRMGTASSGLLVTGRVSLVYAPVVLLGAAWWVAREPGAPVPWTLWAVAGVLALFGGRVTASLTAWLGADSRAGMVAFLGAPSVALASYVGICCGYAVSRVSGGGEVRVRGGRFR